MIPWRKKDLTAATAEENPFALLHRQIDDLFEDFFGESGLGAWRGGPEGAGIVSPRFEISESDEAVEVSAELPGMDEKDIDVTLDEHSLTVKGEKKAEREEKKRNYHVSERSYGEFRRVIPLPAGVDQAKVKATFKKGVLHVTVPKTEQPASESRRIKIE